MKAFDLQTVEIVSFVKYRKAFCMGVGVLMFGFYFFFSNLNFWEFPLGQKILQLYVDIFILIQDQSTYWNFSWLYTGGWVFAYYPACGISLPAARSHNVRKLHFDNMDIKWYVSLKDFLYPVATPSPQLPSICSNQMCFSLLSPLVWKEQTVLFVKQSATWHSRFIWLTNSYWYVNQCMLSPLCWALSCQNGSLSHRLCFLQNALLMQLII